MVDAPPVGVDAAVWSTLRAAHASRARVTVRLRNGVTPGDPARELVGQVVQFDLGSAGGVRVAIDVADGTEQRVLVERIAAATFAEAEATVPTAVVVADDARVRTALAGALEVDGWHVLHAVATDVVAAAFVTPALLALAATPRRPEATLTTAYALRRQSELAETPILVGALGPLDIAPALRRLPHVQVLVMPFDPPAVRRAIEELEGTAARRAPGAVSGERPRRSSSSGSSPGFRPGSPTRPVPIVSYAREVYASMDERADAPDHRRK